MPLDLSFRMCKINSSWGWTHEIKELYIFSAVASLASLGSGSSQQLVTLENPQSR